MTDQSTDIPSLEVSRSDDPQVVKEARTEDYSLHAVPRTWRNSRGSLAMAFWAFSSAGFYLIVSATIALQVGTVNTIIGMVLAALVTGVINFFISSYASRSGLTVNLFSRTIFGQVGAALAAFIAGTVGIYYAVFESAIIAVVFNTYFGGIPLAAWYLIVVLYSVPLILRGVGVWLDKFNGVLLPFYVLGLVLIIVATLVTQDYSNEWLTFQPETGAAAGPGWVLAFSTYMGVWIIVMFAMDFGRFGRPEDSRFNGIVTFGPLFFLFTWITNGLIGLFVIFLIPTEGELTETSGVLGIVALLGLAGVIFFWVSQTRINTGNFYLASTNLQSCFERALGLRLSRTVWAVIVGVIVYALLLTNVFSYIQLALSVQGLIVVSWVAIALVQIAYERLRQSGIQAEEAGETEFRPGRVPLFNPAGLTAWFLAVGVGVVLLFGTEAIGTTWAPPIAFVLAASTYALSLRFARRSWFVMKRPHDPRLEVDDQWEDRVKCEFCGRSYIAYEVDRDPGSGHRPICASCASARPSLYRNAKREADAFRVESTAASPTVD